MVVQHGRAAYVPAPPEGVPHLTATSPLAAGTAGWRGLADCLSQLCGVPDMSRLQLRALCCWALSQPGTPPAERPLLLRGKPRLSPEFRRLAQQGITPILSLLLIEMPLGLSPGGMLTSLQQVASGKMPPMHTLHVVGFDMETEEVGSQGRPSAECITESLRMPGMRTCLLKLVV